MNQAADAITRVAHPDANIIFGAVVDDALGEEVRVTVVAAGFDKVTPSAGQTSNQFESRLSRLLEEPVRGEGESVSRCRRSWPTRATTTSSPPASRSRKTVSFDAEEDLDIPDFLKS